MVIRANPEPQAWDLACYFRDAQYYTTQAKLSSRKDGRFPESRCATNSRLLRLLQKLSHVAEFSKSNGRNPLLLRFRGNACIE
jgi:hypothetical protein